ncbi:hypothetical protein [Clostridium massiliodielmoense]|uniref:hypothetical protein n=1 Tax=Clostridium massiliodielmoense TaxID=1776385 RepID=UPI000A267795|nr:hypothetical protein [Clostridium massiliodielmoense]
MMICEIKKRKNFLIAILFISIIFISKIVYSNIRTKKWREDIQYVATTLNKNHPNLYENTSKEKFNNSIEKLKKDVPNLKQYEIELRIQEILSTLRDGHTKIDTPKLAEEIYPLRLIWFKDKLIAIEAEDKYKDVLGKELIKINDVPINDVLKEINKFPSYENEQNLKVVNSNIILWYKVLKCYGITNSKNTTFTFKDNDKKQNINMYPIRNLKDEKLAKLRDFAPKKPVRIEYDPKRDDINYWYRYIKEDKILYLQDNSATQGIVIKNNKIVKDGFQELKDKIQKTVESEKIDKFIIDVRYNRGGSFKGSEILYENLKPYLSNAKTFIFTGPATFSAPIIETVNLKLKYPNKIISLGEEPGQSIKFYSREVFKLPNSKLILSCSVALIDMTKSNVTIPDVYIQETIEDFKNGIDPLYEWVKKYDGKSPLTIR